MPNKHSLNLRVKTRDRAAIRFVPFIVDRYNAHKDSGIFIGHEANWAWFFLRRHLSYARMMIELYFLSGYEIGSSIEMRT